MHKLILLAALAAAATAASADPVAIDFRLAAGGRPFDCASPARPLGRAATPVRLRDARLYLHGFALLRRDGSTVPLQLQPSDWQVHGVALIDFEDGSGGCSGGSAGVHTRVLGDVPAGDYTGLAFVVGVPVQALDDDGRRVLLNHSNPELAPPPLDSQAMAWNWQAGRKFVKIEVLPEGGVRRAGDTVRVWTLHLGSTGCQGDVLAGSVACRQPNRVEVRLDGFDPSRQQVELDLDALFAASDLGRDAGGSAGCMSAPDDPECPPLFAAFGLTPAPQRVFRGVAK
ncbi:MbnP family copper-binding protein [Rubrivivax gelatinosus]|uniref:Putative repeat protein (TIGR04052 family) n=1 Tax=Rubrivivax gelatinosus TaxID=28068 RepID=A0A4R2LX20_RUBGE|nr:MbnP family copper-binding protein [Rubrivivax gelatinosus]MBK1689140.1 metallo-mystery pair system four-Cys motif protein [Rubrivivax gelatinosus]TCO98009.1 putative repeat protein (TIGR04052 family) [Rubrivivax gelatinosus]